MLISHQHHDHLDVASLRRLGPDVRVIGPPGAVALLRRRGFRNTTELGVGGRATVGGAEIEAVAAEHDGRRLPFGPPEDALGFVVTGERRVYFAGDTDLFDGLAELAGTLDVALLPIWGWGPSLGPGHMDPTAAARAVALLRPRITVPIHWGTFFPAGLARVRGGPLMDPPRAFARQLQELAPDADVRVLLPGETLELGAG